MGILSMLFGKRRRRRSHKSKKKSSKGKKPSAQLRRLCKRLHVKLTTARGGHRVYKKSSLLKKQCRASLRMKAKGYAGRKRKHSFSVRRRSRRSSYGRRHY